MLNELALDGVIQIENLSGWTNRYVLLKKEFMSYSVSDYLKKKDFKIKDSLPESVKYRLRKIQEIREEKYMKSL